MPVYKIKHVVTSVGMFFVAVGQIDISRICAHSTRAFGIIVCVVVNAHHFSPLFRLLLVNGRNGRGLAYQLCIVVWPVRSFRLFLLLIRR